MKDNNNKLATIILLLEKRANVSSKQTQNSQLLTCFGALAGVNFSLKCYTHKIGLFDRHASQILQRFDELLLRSDFHQAETHEIRLVEHRQRRAVDLVALEPNGQTRRQESDETRPHPQI